MRRGSTPAQLYKDSLKGGGLKYRGSEPEIYEQLQADWGEYVNQGGGDLGKFLCAVGLVAYGHLDCVDAVLDCAPTQRRYGKRVNARTLARVVKDLIPIPVHLDPENDDHHGEIKAWVREHADRLTWSEADGRFVFRPHESRAGEE